MEDSSEQSTIDRPPKPVQTANRACVQCNRKKTKCDMVRPKCGLCFRTCSECTFPTKRKAPFHSEARPQKHTKITIDFDPLVQLLGWSSPASGKLPPSNEQSFNAILPSAHTQYQHPGVSGTPCQNPAQEIVVGLDDPSLLLQTPANVSSSLASLSGSSPPQRLAPASSTIAVDVGPSASKMPDTGSFACPTSLSYSCILRLTDLFFDHIQPWLPVLHKPRFYQSLSAKLENRSVGFSQLPVNEALLLSSMFALSCRFLSPSELSGLSLQQCVDTYFQHTLQKYKDARSIETPPTLTYLQGCILLAFNYYTSGLTFQGWICVGVCVRLAYELGIADIDSEEAEITTALDWIDKEERRRAWWLVWELDTFGSSISKRPFSIDWRRTAVKLPVPDQAWFAAQEVEVPKIPSRRGNIQIIFDKMPTTDARPWFLLAQLLNTRAHEYLQQNEGVSLDERTVLENEINCLRLGLPSAFNCLSNEADSSAYETSKSNWNWIIGTNLLLSSSSYIVRNLAIDDRDSGDLGLSHRSMPNGQRTSAVELTRIMSYWPLEFFPTAHPFLACQLLTVDVQKGKPLEDNSLSTSSNNVAKVIQHKLGTKWRLASLALRMNEISSLSTSLRLADLQLINRYPIWFPQEMRRKAAAALNRQANLQEQVSLMSREGTRPVDYDLFEGPPPTSLSRAGKDTPSSDSSTFLSLQGAPFTHEGSVRTMDPWDLDLSNHDIAEQQFLNESGWHDVFLDAPLD